MDLAGLDLLPVIAGAIGAMVVGFLWYGPLFGKHWMKLVGKSESELKKGKNMNQMYFLSFLAAFVEALVLAQFVEFAGATDLVTGAMVGFWAWLGFVATTMWVNYMYSGKPTNLYMVDTGYHLAVLVVMGALIGLLG